MKNKKGLLFGAMLALGIMSVAVAPKHGKLVKAAALDIAPSVESGFYGSEFDLTLNSEGAKTIYYTTDGSNPATSGTRQEYAGSIKIVDRSGDDNYLSAVKPSVFDASGTTNYVPKNTEVDKGTVIKAVAVDESGNYGAVVTNTYFVGTVADHIKGAQESAAAAGFDLPVVSISMEYADLFDPEKGIYVKGNIYDQAVQDYKDAHNGSDSGIDARSLPANYSQKGKEWERAAHIDYFETDGTTASVKLQQDCGIRIQGNYSRSDLMKGFRLYAREEYGKKNFKYGFFQDAKDPEGNVIEKYKKIVLRNGGNYAFYGTKYNDPYWQDLMSDFDCETQSSKPCIVYIDGEYWGLYILEQDYDDTYFQETHGVNKDDVVVYKASDAEADKEYAYKLDEGEIPEGEKTDYYYNDLYAFFNAHSDNSIADDESYEEFCKLVDVESLIDYFAGNVFINNKWDWPGKNWSMWRTTVKDETNEFADNRWRFCLYDLDFGGCGGSGETRTNTIKDDYNYDGNTNGLLGQKKTEAFNPLVQCFIMGMSNQKFRFAFRDRLNSVCTTNFEPTKAVEKLDWFKGAYSPLFKQFYTRFFGASQATTMTNNTVSDYAGYNNLKAFVQGRSKGITSIISWLNKKYGDPAAVATPEPTIAPTPEPTIAPTPKPTPTVEPTPKAITNCKVTAKKNKKKITVATLGKAKVTITMTKKVLIKGKKKVKKITKTASSTGKATFKLSKKLKKNTKITVLVQLDGYTDWKKKIKVK